MKQGDLVRVYPEFLDQEGEPDVGVIVGPSTPEYGYARREADGWGIVLRGDQLVHHPKDTIFPIEVLNEAG